MKIALVGVYASPEATGLRLVSSFLKSRGHQVRMILMTAKRSHKSQRTYKPELIEQFVEKVRDCDLVGMGLMTNCYYQARELTEAIRRVDLKSPVVWGGVHPTVAPESCIDFADIVCVGEGEWPMLELADAMEAGKDYSRIPSLWVRQNGHVVKNEVRPLHENLDEMPFADYEIDNDHYVVHKGDIVPAEPDKMRHSLVRYRLLTTRGCPYACAFCCNSTWLRTYRGKGPWVRKRSIAHVLDELEAIKRRFPTVNSVNVADDTFFVRDESEFEEFAEGYRSRIGWPFEINTHPATISDRKVQLLQSCGCWLIKMGIQSGCQATNYEIYNRRVSNERIIEAIRTLERFPALRKEYHFIVSNPFENDESMIETLHFAAEHQGSASRALIFPLAFFPGSQLYLRAKEQGLLKDEQAEIYERIYTGAAKRQFVRLGYLTMLLQIAVNVRRWGIPRPIVHRFIDLMTCGPVRACLDRSWFKWTAIGAYLGGRKVSRILGQAVRPFRKRQPAWAVAAEPEG